MEENSKKTEKIDFILNLINQNNLTITGANKLISLKPDLIQLDTIMGGLIIHGQNLELSKLNSGGNIAEVVGTITEIKFLSTHNKTPFFRKLFKWFFPQLIN